MDSSAILTSLRDYQPSTDRPLLVDVAITAVDGTPEQAADARDALFDMFVLRPRRFSRAEKRQAWLDVWATIDAGRGRTPIQTA